MANPTVPVEGKTVYKVEATVTAVAGDTGILITFPVAVPAGKIVEARVRVSAEVKSAS